MKTNLRTDMKHLILAWLERLVESLISTFLSGLCEIFNLGLFNFQFHR